ncbi:hypothetical protein TRFO_02917 [Tritrichomonas foetus]|uniref:DUF3447 domain-containing protein n=1 Tax=Tritrichomonas foetus TaxID=1144522 RepID=A0A1J4KXF7_9EUKA|nr:hypothetical protein TRFO_02917 [Tritrichomonas foetus]|eukprot:OHT15568.1 hypothetical protein TRFO_02917 [Tritrichomonas foetus]
MHNTLSTLQIIDSIRSPGQIDNKNADHFLLSSQLQITNTRYLLEALASYPKDFVIINQGKRYEFANFAIRDISTVINKLDADIREYTIDIDDPCDSMAKFTSLFNGETATVDIKAEKPFFKKFGSLLLINLPPVLSSSHEQMGYTNPYSFTSSKTLKMAFLPYTIQSLSQKITKNFVIRTKNNQYSCNFLTVTLAGKISQALKENPELTEYEYDIEDENKEFQFFQDFFRFEPCQITSHNLDFIERVANELDIKCAIKRIEEYKKKIEDGQKVLDLEQDQIQFVINLQELLFDLSEDNFESTKVELFESIWFNDSERIKEFSSNLAIVADYRPRLHFLLIKLIAAINDQNSDFLPFFTQYILNQSAHSFGRFIYLMYKENLIKIEQILEQIWENVHFEVTEEKYITNSTLFLWFFPEVEEKYPFFIDNFVIRAEKNVLFNVMSRLPNYRENNWMNYKIARDELNNNDPFAKAILEDNVDSLQKLVSGIQFDFSHKIPMSIFENYEPICLIDYAALHSSILCFKYLMLNHADITNNTLVNAIKGGDNEIIHVTNQKIPGNWESPIQPANNWGPNHLMIPGNFHPFNENIATSIPGFNVLKEAVRYHRYGVFDWLISTSTDQTRLIQILQNCMFVVISTNNIVSLMSIIDSGVNLTSKNPGLNNALRQNSIDAASRGYSDLLKIILKLTDKSIFHPPQQTNHQTHSMYFTGDPYRYQYSDQKSKTILEAASEFGSIRIINMMIEARTDKPVTFNEIVSSLSAAAANGHLDVIQLWINSNVKAISQLDGKAYTKFLQKAAYFGHIHILNAFIDNEECDWLEILQSAAQHGQLEIVKMIMNQKLHNQKNNQLNDAFCLAAKNGFIDICVYLADKNIDLTYEEVGSVLNDAANKGYIEVLRLLFKMLPKEIYEKQTNKNLISAIENSQVAVAKLFITLSDIKEDTLIRASRKGLLELVQILCEKNPEYLNSLTMKEGSALCAAASSGSLETVEFLLNQPGINLNLYNSRHETAIIMAAKHKHFEIMKRIIQEYNPSLLKKNIWQINAAFVMFYRENPKSNGLSQKPQRFGLYHAFVQQQNRPQEFDCNPEFNYSILDYFLNFKGINPNYMHNGMTPLHAAVMQNNMECVSVLINRPEIDVNILDISGRTPLMIAITVGNVKLVKLLIDCERVDINFMNSKNESAISLSGLSDTSDRIASEITNSLRFEADLPNTNIAVINSFIYNRESIFNHLMTLNFDINRKVPSNNKPGILENILSAVCNYDGAYDHALPLVLGHPRFDPNRNDITSCLFALAKRNNLNTFNMLLAIVNDDVNIRNSSGATLLTEATKCCAINIVQGILSNVNFDPVLSDVKTAFIYALSADNLLINLLADQPGIDLNEPVFHHTSFFTKKMANDFFSDDLIDSVGMSTLTTNGMTPLTIASRRADLLSSIIRRDGVDINKKCDNGSAPLLESIVLQNGTLDEFLRLPAIDVNIQNRYGQTALMLAIENRFNYGVNSILAKDGVDITIQDYEGYTAFDYLIRLYGTPIDSKPPETAKEFSKIYNVMNSQDVINGMAMSPY